ncbi:hypothetical protein DL95DRAFT_411595 [Leptodontidium sp. 2 PMI_412]|nr:hypothetical protein DL95DRAFT_411595 [Leptodontidium sp. 2 PMI_412]
MEESLLEFLSIAADDEEIATYGKIYRVAKASPSTNGQSILAPFLLDADITYNRNMFLAQVRDSFPEVLATPGYSIVDISGGTTEIEADVKPIATVFSGKSDPKEYLRKRNTKLDLTMKMDHFYYEREPLETNKDEVYWSIASGADNQDKVESTLASMDFLKKASKKCIEASVDCPKNGGWDESRMDAKTMLAPIGAIVALFDAIISWIRNDDDLVEKMFGWDRDALEGLLNYGGPQIFAFIDRTNSSHALFYKLIIKSLATIVLLESPEGMVGGAEIIQYSSGTGSSVWLDKSSFSPFGPSEHGALLTCWNKELCAFSNTDSTGRTVLTFCNRNPVNG